MVIQIGQDLLIDPMGTFDKEITIEPIQNLITKSPQE
tara:strand:- start:331 stop:441 length:111 start_codon:yes stop_codon:yes gene_type:complete